MKPGANILVVEDAELISDLIQHILQEEGCKVTLIPDGAGAWQALKSGAVFDLVLLDRGLPDMDGLELLQRIKADAALKQLPVVIQTGLDDANSISKGIAAGAYYYLTKPLQPALMLSVIQAAINQQQEYAAMQAALTGTIQTLHFLESGVFRYQTLAQARALAQSLARAFPDPSRAVLGLQELMINAVEHGNYGISYAQKSLWLMENRWHEELERLQADPVCRQRWATVHLSRTPEQLILTIQDQGEGFDWHDYLDFSPARALDLHGRGIAMARLTSFDALDYQGNGNTVTVKVNLPPVTAAQAADQPGKSTQ